MAAPVSSADTRPAIVQAVRTTGIYCRPECSARPDPRNVTTFASAAAAEAAGYRACHCCRPYRRDAAMGGIGPDLVCRAVQMVVDGALDEGGEDALAARVGVSSRHLRRLFDEHLGVSPDGLARSRRAHFARRLLDDTDLPVRDVAFAAGFGSVRQLQRACTQIFGAAPRELRARRRTTDRLVADGGLDLRLGPLERHRWSTTRELLAAEAIPGMEVVDGELYRRTVNLGNDPGVIEIRPGSDALLLRTHLPRWHGLIHVVAAARRLAGLDREARGGSPHDTPAGAWDPFEDEVRAVLSAEDPGCRRALLAAFVVELGAPVDGLGAMGLTHTFPSPATVAAADLGDVGLGAAACDRIARAAGAALEVDGPEAGRNLRSPG